MKGNVKLGFEDAVIRTSLIAAPMLLLLSGLVLPQLRGPDGTELSVSASHGGRMGLHRPDRGYPRQPRRVRDRIAPDARPRKRRASPRHGISRSATSDVRRRAHGPARRRRPQQHGLTQGRYEKPGGSDRSG